MKKTAPSIEVIQNNIFVIREHRVMMDVHLGELYGVEIKVLVQAVKRNLDRFPEDFMFQINDLEYESLRSQFVTLKTNSRGQHRKYLPYVFTEQGVSMLSSVLRSKRAVQVNIGIMRTFVKMREAMIAHKDLSRRLNDMERKYHKHFRVVFDAIRQLMEPAPVPSKRPIGFIQRDKE